MLERITRHRHQPQQCCSVCKPRQLPGAAVHRGGQRPAAALRQLRPPARVLGVACRPTSAPCILGISTIKNIQKSVGRQTAGPQPSELLRCPGDIVGGGGHRSATTTAMHTWRGGQLRLEGWWAVWRYESDADVSQYPRVPTRQPTPRQQSRGTAALQRRRDTWYIDLLPPPGCGPPAAMPSCRMKPPAMPADHTFGQQEEQAWQPGRRPWPRVQSDRSAAGLYATLCHLWLGRP